LAFTSKYPYGEIEPFQNPTFKEAKPPSFYNKNIPAWLDSVILRSIAIDKEQRYSHYSEMNYELSHPNKVKPYFIKNAPLIVKSPHIFYKRAFTLMTFLNFMLIYLLLK
ncbi:MAG: bifunctional protein-serine/threonine kinase/phosphatase, partial [Campylobacterota bacterium]|nr:bifunctional protein-serine/threonine kinase/phosphatase [Campylobacterota bacterium]